MSSPQPNRRALIRAVVGGGVAVGAVGAAVRLSSDDGHDDDQATLSLSPTDDSDVASLEVRLGDDLLPSAGGGSWQSDRLPTSVHSLIGFTWTGDVVPHLEVKSRTGRTWTDWLPAPLLQDMPDAGAEEGNGRSGTELLWIGSADGVQVRATGARPDDLTLVLIAPAKRSADAALDPPTLERRAAGEPGKVPAPAYRTRKQWGANESWRDGSPRYIRTIRQVHVHHTVNANDYAKNDVPRLIRGMYRYHTHNLGWSDIGYNFLVDRFGRIWVGRAGGPHRNVRGAHTLGFNNTSCGVSVIGNFETGTPSNAILDAVAAVAAWKLDRYHRDPTGSIAVTSEGSDRFSAGRTVTLPVIDGHRDTNETACPGSRLYARIPMIRQRAKAIVTDYHTPDQHVAIKQSATLLGQTSMGSTLRVKPGTYQPAGALPRYRWLRDGKAIPGARNPTYTCQGADVGREISVRVIVDAPGYLPRREVVRSGSKVTGPSRMQLQVTTGKRTVSVKVRVQPPPGGSVPPEGKVRFVMRGRRRRAKLQHGVATTRYVRMRPGRARVQAEYVGSKVYRGVKKARFLRIPG